MNKEKARKKYRGKRDGLNVVARSRADNKICEALFALEGFTDAESYLVYLNFGSEVATAGIISELLARGKKVYVPKIAGGTMYAAEAKPPFIVGKFGISEPANSVFAEKTDVAVTPLIAADKQLNRVGYGKGYYDKYFAAHPECFKVGICYSAQVAKEIECEATDVPLDALVTEKFTLGRNMK